MRSEGFIASQNITHKSRRGRQTQCSAKLRFSETATIYMPSKNFASRARGASSLTKTGWANGNWCTASPLRAHKVGSAAREFAACFSDLTGGRGFRQQKNRTLLQQIRPMRITEFLRVHNKCSRKGLCALPNSYPKKQNGIAVWAPTKRPARNGHYSKTFNTPRVLTLARAWHCVHTPAHQVSKNRPRKSSSEITIFFYIRYG